MPTLDEIKAGIDRNLPAGWVYDCWPMGAVDNPVDLAERRIYGLAYDSAGAAVGAGDADWILFRFAEDRRATAGAMLFVWADSIRGASDAAAIDAIVADVLTTAGRRLESIRGVG